MGSGVDITIRALAESVADTMGYTGQIMLDASKPNGIPKKQLDVSRLASLGWRSRISLEEGLKNTAELFREHLSHGLVRL